MGGLFGGGGSTQTVTQNSTPFNAQQLNTVQNAAINLGQNNPLNFYPGQIYAPPNDTQNNALTQTGNLATQAGNTLGGQVPGLQQDAINANRNIANGGNFGTLNPVLNAMNGLANTNAAQPGINYLSPIANGGYFNQEQPYISGLQNAATSGPGAGQLNNIANGGYLTAARHYLGGLEGVASGPGGNVLGNVAGGQYLQGASPYLSGLSSAANGPGGNVLGNVAGGQYLQGASPYLSGLSSLSSGTAANDLAKTANGDFLNSNPYLTGMFNAASQPVLNAFQTATAPTIDSQMAANGRFGSGANLNAQSVAQQNLGTTLNNLSSNIYGTDYANERGLMNPAASGLGNLQTNALTNALSGYGTQTGQLGSAASNLGNLNLGGLSGALSGYGTQTGQLGNAASALGNLNLGGLTNAGNLYSTQTGQIGNAANNLLSGNISGLNAAANQYNNAVEQMRQAGFQTGLLGVQGQGQQMQGFQNQFNDTMGLTNQQLNAANALPGLAQLPFQDYQTALNAGTGTQQNNQAAINALMQQFYGQQNAPWNTLQTEAGIVGSGIPGMTATTTPVPTSPFGNIMGGLGGANALFGGNGLFGGAGGGLFGGLGGQLGGTFAAGTGAGAGIGTNLLTGATSDVLGSGVAAPGFFTSLLAAL